MGLILKLKWLKESMLTFLAEPTPQQLAAHCRAYILGLIGGVLMSDKLGNKVHLMYLPLLIDLDQVVRHSWGSTCLTHLYKEMCRAISKKMEGCTMLLQSWLSNSRFK